MEPLRQLSHKDANWDWSPKHDTAIATIKKLICEAPILRYFDQALPVTLECDASEGGLGYALLQQGQPIAFGVVSFPDRYFFVFVEVECARDKGTSLSGRPL